MKPNGADPWWGEAIRLLIKYPNLHLMTSAYLPKYFPAELVHFMNTRGADKILYASDHPVLAMRRCIQAAVELDLREGVLEKFLYDNAQRLFFSPRKPWLPRDPRHKRVASRSTDRVPDLPISSPQ